MIYIIIADRYLEGFRMESALKVSKGSLDYSKGNRSSMFERGNTWCVKVSAMRIPMRTLALRRDLTRRLVQEELSGGLKILNVNIFMCNRRVEM